MKDRNNPQHTVPGQLQAPSKLNGNQHLTLNHSSSKPRFGRTAASGLLLASPGFVGASLRVKESGPAAAEVMSAMGSRRRRIERMVAGDSASLD